MGLKKGQTNNPNGRPPDAKVKLYRDTVRDKQIERIARLYEELDMLDGKDYIELYLRINKDIFPSLPAEVSEEQVELSIVSIFETTIDKMMEVKKKELGKTG